MYLVKLKIWRTCFETLAFARGILVKKNWHGRVWRMKLRIFASGRNANCKKCRRNIALWLLPFCHTDVNVLILSCRTWCAMIPLENILIRTMQTLMKSCFKVFAVSRFQKESAWKSGCCLIVANPMKRWIDGGLRRGWQDLKEGALVILPTLTSCTFSRVIQGEKLMTTSARQRPSPRSWLAEFSPSRCMRPVSLQWSWWRSGLRTQYGQGLLKGLLEKLPGQGHLSRVNRFLRIHKLRFLIVLMFLMILCICCYVFYHSLRLHAILHAFVTRLSGCMYYARLLFLLLLCLLLCCVWYLRKIERDVQKMTSECSSPSGILARAAARALNTFRFDKPEHIPENEERLHRALESQQWWRRVFRVVRALLVMISMFLVVML